MTIEKNVYQKIQFVRSELVRLNLKKTGRNDYSKFTYYELSDFLPALNELMNSNGLMTRFVIQSKKENNPEKAVLDIFNSDNPTERVTFYSETADVEIGKTKDGTGGAQLIQNLGGKITYMRRYLLMTAFEIVEGDSVDSQNVIALEKSELDKIMKMKDLEKLKEYCGELKKDKGVSYQKVILKFYNQRKEQLNEK